MEEDRPDRAADRVAQLVERVRFAAAFARSGGRVGAEAADGRCSRASCRHADEVRSGRCDVTLLLLLLCDGRVARALGRIGVEAVGDRVDLSTTLLLLMLLAALGTRGYAAQRGFPCRSARRCAHGGVGLGGCEEGMGGWGQEARAGWWW